MTASVMLPSRSPKLELKGENVVFFAFFFKRALENFTQILLNHFNGHIRESSQHNEDNEEQPAHAVASFGYMFS
jgi:hypothetical protein